MKSHKEETVSMDNKRKKNKLSKNIFEKLASKNETTPSEHRSGKAKPIALVKNKRNKLANEEIN